jgi:hypothetical protein
MLVINKQKQRQFLALKTWLRSPTHLIWPHASENEITAIRVSFSECPENSGKSLVVLNEIPTVSSGGASSSVRMLDPLNKLGGGLL